MKKAPTFEKEVLHETVIVKGSETYPITSDFLKNCVVQYRRMKKNGMKVNVHSGHNHSPETKRGEVLDLYVKTRGDGRVGLFGKIAFLPHLSKQTIQTLVSNDVSVELPQELYDAKGNLYPFPVQRVAITPDPAVSGMQPFVNQRDTSISVPFLTLSIDTFNKEQDNMDNELFDQNDEGQENALDAAVDTADDEIDTGDNGVGNEHTVSVKNKGSFIESQLAKVMFDTCGIDPDTYDNEDGLINELNQRLASIITLQSRALAAFNIDDDDPNRYELFTERLDYIVNILNEHDEDGDGMLDEEEAQNALEEEADDGGNDTIDGSISQLEQNDKNLQLSLNNLQKKYAEAKGAIKGLVAKNRQLELDGMLQGGVLTKAAHQKATQKFVLKLSLNDGFDDFVDVARVNARSVGHSRTPVQQPASNPDATESWVKVGKRLASTYRRESESES